MIFHTTKAPPHAEWFSFNFDGDDEPGDPSGLHLIFFGRAFGLYHPMHFQFEISYSPEHGFRFSRW